MEAARQAMRGLADRLATAVSVLETRRAEQTVCVRKQ